MKIQCACGAKYAFDITPDMARNPVRFVCPGCGLDSSEYVNQLVREELAGGIAIAARTRPVRELPLRQTLLAEPKALAIVGENLHRRRADLLDRF